MMLHADNAHDDTAAIQTLLAGRYVLDARIELEITAPTLAELPPGSYRVLVPSRWPLATPEPSGRAML